MRLSAFQVQKYKTALDSGRVEVRPDVTCLLGQNESGKSSILQALWKTKNVAGQKFDRLYDYTKHLYTKERSTNSVVTVLEFVLEAAEQTAFVRECGAVAPTKVVLTTTYDGKSTLAFELDVAEPDFEPLLTGLKTIIAEPVRATEGESDPLATVREQAEAVHNQVAGGQVAEAKAAAAAVAKAIQAVASHFAAPPTEVIQRLNTLASLKGPAEIRATADEWLTKQLPAFIYFDEYGVLKTRIHLPAYLQDAKKAKKDVRAQTALFEWASLKPQELLELGRTKNGDEEQVVVDRRKEERRTLLQSASFSLSGDWKQWWPQDREHQLHLDADGDDVVLQVSDSKNPWPVDFQERSRGFQWFFSFYLTFLVESEQAHQGAILLLDEPGLHLHITAQKYLMGFFQAVSKKNQIIYSSHSPFMVDPKHLENVRTVYLKKDETTGYMHTKVAAGTEPGGDRATLLPLQAALAYEVADTLFLGKKMVIVEGVTDYWMLKALSAELAKCKRTPLPDDVVVLFAGGTSHMLPLVSLFADPANDEKRLVVLLDADKAGLDKASKLKRDLLRREGAVALMSDPDLLAQPHREVEDIIGRTELVRALTAFKAGAKVQDPTVDGNVPFLKRVFTDSGWGELDHEQKANLVLSVVDAWRNGNGPDDDTLANAEKVILGLLGRLK